MPKGYGNFSPSSIYTAKCGATVHYQTERVGYGFTRYQIIGTREQLESAMEDILRSYPNNPYGTHFDWPPDRRYRNSDGSEGRLMDGQPMLFPAKEDGALWYTTGSHSNTSD